MSSVEPDDAASSPTARDVVAFNLAAASENKIHDDAVARRLGYHGGLVPGVAVYAYMAHMPVKRWGRAWLENGIAECRLRKPVYDGALVRVTAVADGDVLALAAESGGLECATGEARLAHVPAKTCPGLDPRWTPVRRQEHAPNEESRARSDSEGTERALVGFQTSTSDQSGTRRSRWPAIARLLPCVDVWRDEVVHHRERPNGSASIWSVRTSVTFDSHVGPHGSRRSSSSHRAFCANSHGDHDDGDRNHSRRLELGCAHNKASWPHS
jgi:hypothetical protein